MLQLALQMLPLDAILIEAASSSSLAEVRGS